MQPEGSAIISVRFGELWLRGRNRSRYISLLLRNISERLNREDVSITREYDRVLIAPGKNTELEGVKAKLSTVFGISRFEVAYVTSPDLASIKKLGSALLSKLGRGTSVRIRSHRSYKQLDFDSITIVRELVKPAKRKGLVLTSKGFDNDISVNVTKSHAFISTASAKGAGGLPVGSSGKAVVLLSGGIDSPVAAWYAMKRGMSPIYLHFHGFPDGNARDLLKIKNIADKLNEYSLHYRLYLLPTHQFQVAALGSGRSETVLLKHFMLRSAERIAKLEGASLIYTGDCLGQVSSQTPQNLLSQSQGIKYPVIRPLIGFDKEEIISTARRIGTYEMSLLPYHDVCSINARNPGTAVSEKTIKLLARERKMAGVSARSLRFATIIER